MMFVRNLVCHRRTRQKGNDGREMGEGVKVNWKETTRFTGCRDVGIVMVTRRRERSEES